MKVEIYSTPSCGQCNIAKSMLKAKNIEFIEYVVGQNAEKSDIETRCDCIVRSVPQIFINDSHVGGVNELRERLTAAIE